MEYAEPLDALFDPAAPGIFAAVVNGGATVYGEFEVQTSGAENDLGDYRGYLFHCPLARYAGAIGDTLVIDGVTYQVFQSIDDQLIVTHHLHKQ